MLTVVCRSGHIHMFKTAEYHVEDGDLMVETEHGPAWFGAGFWAWAIPGPSGNYIYEVGSS